MPCAEGILRDVSYPYGSTLSALQAKQEAHLTPAAARSQQPHTSPHRPCSHAHNLATTTKSYKQTLCCLAAVDTAKLSSDSIATLALQACHADSSHIKVRAIDRLPQLRLQLHLKELLPVSKVFWYSFLRQGSG